MQAEAGQWHHVAYVWNGKTALLYVDNIVQELGAATGKARPMFATHSQRKVALLSNILYKSGTSLCLWSKLAKHVDVTDNDNSINLIYVLLVNMLSIIVSIKWVVDGFVKKNWHSSPQPPTPIRICFGNPSLTWADQEHHNDYQPLITYKYPQNTHGILPIISYIWDYFSMIVQIHFRAIHGPTHPLPWLFSFLTLQNPLAVYGYII